MVSRAERAEYERLHKLINRKTREPEPDDDDSPVLMFSGKRADALLGRMFGDHHDDQDDDDQDDDDQDDDDQDDEPDPPTRRSGNKFFGSRSARD
jgi:hypothetical protein